MIDNACEWCDGTGIEKFCPSYPDKCTGCEERTCVWCKGTGLELEEVS